LSKKGSALFKNELYKLDNAFDKVDFEPAIRMDIERVKIKLKREMDEKLKAFKEFIDLEESKKVSQNKQQ
jgi:hypothetical protein